MSYLATLHPNLFWLPYLPMHLCNPLLVEHLATLVPAKLYIFVSVFWMNESVFLFLSLFIFKRWRVFLNGNEIFCLSIIPVVDKGRLQKLIGGANTINSLWSLFLDSLHGYCHLLGKILLWEHSSLCDICVS